MDLGRPAARILASKSKQGNNERIRSWRIALKSKSKCFKSMYLTRRTQFYVVSDALYVRKYNVIEYG